MADGLKAKFDDSQVQRLFDRLQGEVAESLARRMLVSGGVVVRDEAKARVPNKFSRPYNESSRGSHHMGTLRDAIYLVFRKEESSPSRFKYSVTWNAQKAWWGKLVEFDHYVRYAYFIDKDGVYHTIKSKPLPTPVLVPATPFLGPAMDAAKSRVYAAMIARGREELPKLLKGG